MYALLFIVVLFVFPNSSQAQENDVQYEPIIQTLEDIEALAFFIVSKKFGDHESAKFSSVMQSNQTFDERAFQDFLVQLKYTDLLQKHSQNISCSQLIIQYNQLHLSHFEDDQEKLISLCEASSGCKTPLDLVQLVGLSSPALPHKSTKLTLNQAIVRLCPLMLFQMHDDTCASNVDKERLITKLRPSRKAVWGFGLLFVTIISFCSLVGVALMPFLNKKSFITVLNICEGLAVGSLVGSSIFHLIPQSFNLLAEDTNHSYLWKALIIFGGIYLFYWSERIMKLVVDYRRKKKIADMALPSIAEVSDTHKDAQDSENKHVSFNQANGLVKYSDKVANNLSVGFSTEDNFLLHETAENGKNSNHDDIGSRSRSESFTDRISAHANHHDHGLSAGGSRDEIATVAWMIIIGDALHNFIDGLSIGAAFSESILAGISISVAVVCEEFPHELGDFAVLIASGMSLRQAIGYNFLSACTCYLGLVIGILVGDFAEGSTYILALAGGMFLYIALVDMMAELSSSLDDALKISLSRAIHVLVLQNIGILVGIATLFLLAKYSEHINFEGLVPFEDEKNPLTPN
ncbi:Metal cation symporter ZIP14 [Halotydeus destructor]|nr:Metal cation symporter ZIP14 [Halotydeus destructor]